MTICAGLTGERNFEKIINFSVNNLNVLNAFLKVFQVYDRRWEYSKV